MRSFRKPLSYFITLLAGVALTAALFIGAMLYWRVAPAEARFQQACPHFSPQEIRDEYIQSWLRSAGKDKRKAVIGLDRLTFVASPVFHDGVWFGKLQVSGSQSREEAYVSLDCKTGVFDYSATEKSTPF